MIQNTREQLIEVASQLFSRKGVDATTMGDIANASDRGRRTIYTYFRNKREVYSAVLQSEADGLLERLGTIVAAEGPVEQRLREFLSVRLVQRRKQNSPAASLRALFRPDPRRRTPGLDIAGADNAVGGLAASSDSILDFIITDICVKKR